MINYYYDKKNFWKKIWAVIVALYKLPLIVAFATIILGGCLRNLGINYLYFVGVDNFGLDLLTYGTILLSFGFVILAIVIKLVYRFYKGWSDRFKNYSKDGVLHYSLFIRNYKYVIKCTESEIEFEFEKEDIRKISRKCGSIIINIKPNYIADFPDREDIYNLFQS